MARYKKSFPGRGGRQFSSYCNPWHRARYREWRRLPWWKRLLTRRPQSGKLFRLK